jgi:alginate O-acetyltransferase complex protein AlgI
MVFSSILFLLVFLPIFLTIYLIADNRYKNYIALAGSVVFYAWGAPLFIFVIFASIICDYSFAKLIYKAKGNNKRIFLALAIFLNVGILVYFKYSNFFVENANLFLGHFGIHQIPWLKVALPIGISFFTFHEMSYIIDVYRGVKPPMKNIWNYALYILYFPQLIAGPIIRFNEISDQIEERTYQYTIDSKIIGLFRFIIGLAKKVLIANVLGVEVDRIFALTGNDLTMPLAWIGIVAYAFQIYFDFSGYSDMAIGLARIMGFVFPENFNNPYISQNITEFWRRWHMSLSRWMKDYLYISLGGNRVSIPRMYFNLCFVFIISGFWHGAEWNFIIWGAYHGLLLVADRLFLIKLLKKTGKIPSIIITFFLTLIGWVIFRSESLHGIGLYLRKMFSFDVRFTDIRLEPAFWTTLIIGAVFSFFCVFEKGLKIQENIFEKNYSTKRLAFMSIIGLFLVLFSISSLSTSGFNPFIYFRF